MRSLENMAGKSNRRTERQRVYLSEGFFALMKVANGVAIAGRVIDLNPFGLGIVIPDSGDNPVNPGQGIKIDLEGDFFDDTIPLEGVVVHLSPMLIQEKNYVRIGVALSSLEDDPVLTKKDRVKVNEFLPPTATAKHPYLFGVVLFFKVSEISSSEAVLVTSLRNRFVFPGIELSLNLHLPNAGSVDLTADVTKVERCPNHLALTIQIPKVLTVQDRICQYLLSTEGNLTPAQLKTLGFEIRSLDAVSFEFATLEDMPEICLLRHRSYGNHNSKVAEMDPSKMLDAFDEYSRHIVYRHFGRIVAASRIVFNDNKKDRSEIWTKYSSSLDARIWDLSFLEVSRMCVAPDYQGTDLVQKLVIHALKIARQTGVQSIVITSEAKLRDHYVKMGFSNVGDKIEHLEHRTTLQPMMGVVDDIMTKEFARNLRVFLAGRRSSPEDERKET